MDGTDGQLSSFSYYDVCMLRVFRQIYCMYSCYFLLIQVLNERTWTGVHGGRPSKSSIEAHESQANVPDPNNEKNIDAIRYWIKFADFYQMPHITYFDSVGDLIDKLGKITSEELQQISQNMKKHNAAALTDLLEKWRKILTNIAKTSANAPH